MPPDCTIDAASPLACNADKYQATFGYSCSGGRTGVMTSTNKTCPIQCENCTTTQIKNIETGKCVNCPSPKVANSLYSRCECPEPRPTQPGSNCLWIDRTCSWACGQIAGITQQECTDAGGLGTFQIIPAKPRVSLAMAESLSRALMASVTRKHAGVRITIRQSS